MLRGLAGSARRAGIPATLTDHSDGPLDREGTVNSPFAGARAADIGSGLRPGGSLGLLPALGTYGSGPSYQGLGMTDRSPVGWASAASDDGARWTGCSLDGVFLVPEADGTAEATMRVLLSERYGSVRPFLALLSGASALRAAAGGVRVVAASARTVHTAAVSSAAASGRGLDWPGQHSAMGSAP